MRASAFIALAVAGLAAAQTPTSGRIPVATAKYNGCGVDVDVYE